MALRPLLEVRGLSRRFGRLWALKEASLYVQRGEVLGLIGPNGSGKTTLFECVAGLLAADAGELLLDGAPLGTDRRGALYYVPDGIAPWPQQPLRTVLRFFAQLHGVEEGRALGVAASLGLAAVLNDRLGALSKGQRKRALLALGLLTPQPLLLLDEPFDGLDYRQVSETMAVLRAHAAGGRTLFLSIHQLGDAARVCDRLTLLSAGKVVAQGSLPELRARAGIATGGMEEVFLALT